jgi:hypothetical protein
MIITLLPGCTSTEKAPYVIEIRSTGYSGGNDYYRAYYNGDLRMYEYHYAVDSGVVAFDTTKTEAVSSPTNRTLRTRYFLFHKDSTYGYKFEQQTSIREEPERLRVDSIVKTIVLQSAGLEEALQTLPDTIEWSGGRTVLREVYIVKAENGYPGFTRTLYYSKKLNHVGESFSPKLDSARQMKLYKVEAKLAELYNSTTSSILPPSIANEMIVIPMPDSLKAIGYFNEYYKITAEGKKQ